MTKSTLVIALILALSLLAACEQDDDDDTRTITITASGEIETEEKTITDFDRVNVSHAFQVTISQGNIFKVIFHGDHNVRHHLHVVKEGDTLRIGLDSEHQYKIEDNILMEVDVTLPVLSAVSLSGASHAQVTGFESESAFTAELSGASMLQGDIKAGRTRFELSGSSRMILTGSGDDTTVNASGASEVDLADFRVVNADVRVSGESRATVNPSGSLDAEASDASQIIYLGSPTLGKLETSGTASIQPQ